MSHSQQRSSKRASQAASRTFGCKGPAAKVTAKKKDTKVNEAARFNQLRDTQKVWLEGMHKEKGGNPISGANSMNDAHVPTRQLSVENPNASTHNPASTSHAHSSSHPLKSSSIYDDSLLYHSMTVSELQNRNVPPERNQILANNPLMSVNQSNPAAVTISHLSPRKEITCKLCCKSMCVPVLVVPCGHSFCKQCLNLHITKSHSTSPGIQVYCPTCDGNLDYYINNVSLQQFLDSQPPQMQQTSSPKTQVDPVRTFENDEITSSSPEVLADIYKQKYQSYKSRFKIVSQELESLHSRSEECRKGIAERGDKLINAKEDVVLYKSLIAEYEGKLHEVEANQELWSSELNQLQTTLSSLEEGSERTHQAVDHLREMKKKTRIIWQGLSASVQQQSICESGDEFDVKMDM